MKKLIGRRMMFIAGCVCGVMFAVAVLVCAVYG